MRLLYTCLLLLLTPFIILRLWVKGFALPDYRRRIGERFGYVAAPATAPRYWIHAVSVGESLAAVPLIEALLSRYGDGSVWVSTTTPTGSARVIAQFGNRVHHSYAPYDLPWVVGRFLRRVQPQTVVVMETELWPNLFAALAMADIPLAIANARLSPRSFKGYGRVAGFARSVLGAVNMVAAQSALDAERFSALGAPHVRTVGNLKFDFPVPDAQRLRGLALRSTWQASDRPVWIAASTHEGEEDAAIITHQTLRQRMPNALLVLVPRHPQRFDAIAKRLDASGLPWQRRTHSTRSATPPAVVLGDSMGEMYAYLAASDVAFVGGSLVPVGGHNVLEPAALGLPVVFGPHMHNFLAARSLLLEATAAAEVPDATALTTTVATLLADADTRQAMGQAGEAAVAANRGALKRLLKALGEREV